MEVPIFQNLTLTSLPETPDESEDEMIAQIIPLATLIVGGVMLANAIANPAGTKVLIDGVGSLWKVSVNGLLGQPTK